MKFENGTIVGLPLSDKTFGYFCVVSYKTVWIYGFRTNALAAGETFFPASAWALAAEMVAPKRGLQVCGTLDLSEVVDPEPDFYRIADSEIPGILWSERIPSGSFYKVVETETDIGTFFGDMPVSEEESRKMQFRHYLDGREEAAAFILKQNFPLKPVPENHRAKGAGKKAQEPKIDPATTSMSRETFWSIVDLYVSPNKAKADYDYKRFEKHLADLSSQETLAFNRQITAVLDDAYLTDLWGVAYIVNGGCSQDGFEYFIGWLIAQGSAVYRKALKDPDSLGPYLSTYKGSSPIEDEDFLGAPSDAIDAKELDYPVKEPREARTTKPKGEDWDFDNDAECKRRLPKVFAVGMLD